MDSRHRRRARVRHHQCDVARSAAKARRVARGAPSGARRVVPDARRDAARGGGGACGQSPRVRSRYGPRLSREFLLDAARLSAKWPFAIRFRCRRPIAGGPPRPLRGNPRSPSCSARRVRTRRRAAGVGGALRPATISSRLAIAPARRARARTHRARATFP
nr:hypothetical protein [Burkholderia pseudomallei]